MNLYADPTTALTLARYHHDDIRRAIPRRVRRFSVPTIVSRRRYGGATAVPVLVLADELVPSPREATDGKTHDEPARLAG